MLSLTDFFDPIELLTSEEKYSLNDELRRQVRALVLNKFWEFFLVKISEQLDEHMLEEVLNTVNSEQKYIILEKYISDLDQQILKCLEEFKKEVSKGG